MIKREDFREYFDEMVEASTCLKRRIVCILFDEDNDVLAMDSNRCTPPVGGCPRIGIYQIKDANYNTASCVSEHAETRAIAQLPKGIIPTRAVIMGHDFACPDCEKALNDLGVTNIEIIPEGFGTGVIKYVD